MSTNTRGVKKGKSARKYPESSGLNAAGFPVEDQLNNVEERPVIPPSRMAPQVIGGPATPGGYTSHQAGPSDFTYTSYPGNQQSAPQITPTDYDARYINQSLRPGLDFPPAISIYRHPTEDGRLATGTFEYTTGSTAFITGMDRTVLHRRRPVKFGAAPYPSPHADSLRQITAQPTIAPYAQLRADIAEGAGLTKLRPGELVRGVEFSTGVIRVVESSFRDSVRKRNGAGIRLPPPPRPPTTPVSEPGPSGLPLAGTGPMPATTQLPPAILSKNIFNEVRDATKRYVLNTNAMPTRDDLSSILTSAAFAAAGDQVFVPDWIQANEGNVRKLSDTASYIRSTFKNYAAHNVQDAFQLREATAIENGFSEAEWKRLEVSRLLKNFAFLSADTQHPLDPTSGSTMISSQIINLVSDVLFLEDLHKYVDMTGNFIVGSTLAATSYYWALEQHGQGVFTPLDFMVERYAPAYVKIGEIFRSISDTQLFGLFTQTVIRRGQSLLRVSDS